MAKSKPTSEVVLAALDEQRCADLEWLKARGYADPARNPPPVATGGELPSTVAATIARPQEASRGALEEAVRWLALNLRVAQSLAYGHAAEAHERRTIEKARGKARSSKATSAAAERDARVAELLRSKRWREASATSIAHELLRLHATGNTKPGLVRGTSTKGDPLAWSTRAVEESLRRLRRHIP